MAEAEAELEDLFGGSDSDDSGGDNAKAKPGSAQEQLEDEDAAGLEDDVPEPKQGGSSGKAAGASLFGSDSDDDDDDDDAPKQEKPSGAKGGLAISAAQRQQQQQRATPGSDDGEDEERGARGRRQPVAVGPPLDVACTLVPVPAPGSLLLLRTTNIMSIQPRAFDPANFELEQEEYEDSSGKVRVRLASSAVVRWRSRRLPDGREVRESNARLVRWEDGSVQLLLGEEVLDVAQQDMRANAQYLFKQTDGLLQVRRTHRAVPPAGGEATEGADAQQRALHALCTCARAGPRRADHQGGAAPGVAGQRAAQAPPGGGGQEARRQEGQGGCLLWPLC